MARDREKQSRWTENGSISYFSDLSDMEDVLQDKINKDDKGDDNMDQELRCLLCGINFSTGRLRTAEEPIEAAWDWRDMRRDGRYFGGQSRISWAGGCDYGSGCMIAFRNDNVERWREALFKSRLHDGSLLKPMTDNHLITLRTLKAQSIPKVKKPRPEKLSEYIQLIPGNKQKPRLLHIGDQWYWKNNDMVQILRDRLERYGFGWHFLSGNCPNYEAFEHVAGPGGCNSTYPSVKCHNGHRITVEEMFMTNIGQCLMLRERPSDGSTDQYHRPDDEDWEQEPSVRWGLSGLCTRPCDHMPLQDTPRRQSRMPWPGHHTSWNNADYNRCMVFHPTCLEVFKRAAILRHGRFDANDLGKWFVITAHFRRRKLRRHWAIPDDTSSVSLADFEEEWIVANPCYVRGWEPIVAEINQKRGNTCPGDCEDLVERPELLPSKTIANVGLMTLPVELYDDIFNYLPLESVVATAHACTPLRGIINTYLLTRVRVEWPWLWELWCEMPYSKWTTTTEDDLQHKIYARISTAADNEIKTSTTPFGGSVDAEASTAIHRRIFTEMNFVPQSALRIHLHGNCGNIGPDIVYLVYKIFRDQRQNKLNGLKNRARIWQDCQQILDQIDMLETCTNGDWDVLEMQRSGRWTPEVHKSMEDLVLSNRFPVLKHMHRATEKKSSDRGYLDRIKSVRSWVESQAREMPC